MIVVSNTSPITNLHAIGELSLLKRLYGQIHIPPAVQQELQVGVLRGDHPDLETEWGWILVQSPTPSGSLETLLTQLHAGEAEAIALAHELSADMLLMDEIAGRRIAVQYGLPVTGVLGVLLDAKAAGYIGAVRPYLERLRFQVGFWVGEALYQETLRLAGELGD